MIRAKLKRICIGSNWRHTLVRGAILAAVVYCVGAYGLMPFSVQGDSMLPRYKTGDLGTINALAYRWSDPQRFDIVAIRMAGKKVMLLKRVIGLPGETVEIRQGVVYVNGEKLDEPYLLYRGDWNLNLQTVAADQYFVVGDNRGMPADQHHYGKTKRDRIIGRMSGW